MKRLIALLLAVFLLLCGCAAGNEPKALKEQGEGKRTESVAVVKITINPEFELYLDVNFNITKVRCLNEDAVTVLEAVQTNLIGNNYGSAMFSILDAAAQTGFLVPEAQIKIETTLHTPMAEQDLEYMAQSIANPVEVYSENNGLNLSVEAVTPTVDEKAVEAFIKAYEDQTANQPAGNQHGGNQSDKLSGSYTGDITDEKGNRIGTAEHYYDENGNLLNKTLNFDDGTSSYSTYEYDANGTMIREESVYSDGSSGVYTYFANGSIETSLWIASDGYTVTETYYESGILKSRISDYDGNHSEYHYAEDGTLIEEVIENRPWNIGEPNSVVEVQVYGDHGEGTSTQYFNENGYLYREVLEYPGKTPSEFTYYQNGNKETEIFDHDDQHYEHHYYEDGTLQATYQTDIHGNYYEDTYYPTGIKATQIVRYFYGAYCDRTFYENGNMKSEIFNDPNADPNVWQYTESYCYENGQLQKFIGSRPNGAYQEQHFYSNGQMAVNITKGADGSYFEMRFDESGNVTYDSNSIS